MARLASLGFDANVVSRGEWAVARRAGLPNARITLEGVGKDVYDLARGGVVKPSSQRRATLERPRR